MKKAILAAGVVSIAAAIAAAVLEPGKVRTTSVCVPCGKGGHVVVEHRGKDAVPVELIQAMPHLKCLPDECP